MLEASASEGKELILLGDFNCDVSGRHPLQAGFADLAIELNLSQLITEPTRVTEISSTTIGLLFSTNASQFVQSGCVHTSLSDHHMIYGQKSQEVGVCTKKCDV